MKKQLLNMLAVSFVIGIAIVTVISCSKTENENSLEVEKNYQLKEFMPAYEDIVPLINQFNSKYKEYKLGYKSGEEVPLNEAIWNLEAGVNYEYCESIENINDFYSTESAVSIEISENTNGDFYVSEDKLMEAYGELQTFAKNELNPETANFLVADVALQNIIGLDAELSMVVTSGIPQVPSCEIVDEDHWYWAEGNGKCSPYSGGNGHDASTRLDFLLNCMAHSCPGGSVYFTSVQTDPYTHGLDVQYANICNDDTDMQDYLNDSWDKIDIINNSYPGKVYIECEYTYQIEQLGNPPLCRHIIKNAKFGIKNCKPDETK